MVDERALAGVGRADHVRIEPSTRHVATKLGKELLEAGARLAADEVHRLQSGQTRCPCLGAHPPLNPLRFDRLGQQVHLVRHEDKLVVLADDEGQVGDE